VLKASVFKNSLDNISAVIIGFDNMKKGAPQDITSPVIENGDLNLKLLERGLGIGGMLKGVEVPRKAAGQI
jgi:hypothetical protein